MSNAFDKASLVMLPHAYEEGKVYSLKPTDRSGDFTYSRGTDTATRVGEDGYIKKEYGNVLEQSNTFSDAVWNKSSVSVAGGQTGYDGTNDAWNLIPATNITSSHRMYLDYSSAGGVFTSSIYAKANGYNFLRLNNYTGTVLFNLSNGTIESEAAIDGSIESVGNGWYRISVAESSPAGNLRVQLRVQIDAINSSYAGDGVSGILIQDAQLNPGLVAYPYLETTTAPVYGGLTDDMPRLDYSGGATCPSLLLEPSRTNLIPYSEYYNGSGYLLETNATLDSTLYESPEGLNNAYKLNLPSTLSRITHVGLYTGAHSFSVWMRADTSGTISLRCATGNPAVSEQKNVTTEWQRFDITATDGNYWQVIRNSGDTLSSVYIYGHQIEAGSYPTSYIPTYGSSQTRAADDINIPSSADLSIPSDSWTILWDISDDSVAAGGRWVNDSLNNMNLYPTAPNKTRFYWRGIGQYIALGGGSKVIARYDGTTATEFHDGVDKGSASYSGQLPFDFNSALGIGDGKYFLNKIVIFPTALSDSECIALTTL